MILQTTALWEEISHDHPFLDAQAVRPHAPHRLQRPRPLPAAMEVLELWDVAPRRLRVSLEGHSGRIESLEFSRDGRTMASGYGDGTVKLWDLTTGQERVTLKRHGRAVRSLVFAPDGETLVTGSADRTVWLWRAAVDQEAKARACRK